MRFNHIVQTLIIPSDVSELLRLCSNWCEIRKHLIVPKILSIGQISVVSKMIDTIKNLNFAFSSKMYKKNFQVIIAYADSPAHILEP
jgi:hypothetical protein